MSEVEILYRPMGPEELDKVRASEWRRFPPRLSHQPIFYPIREKLYAERIARDWNVRFRGTGHIVQFAVKRDYVRIFPFQTAGVSRFTEYWIPAEKIEEFNDNIVGLIELVGSYP